LLRNLSPQPEDRKRAVFLIDGSGAFSYLAGLLNRMINPAIAAATLLIRCMKTNARRANAAPSRYAIKSRNFSAGN
jgi:hypothetical protein